MKVGQINIRSPTEIEESKKVVFGNIQVDSFLSFNEHVDHLSRRANYKLHALRRIRKYVSLEKAKLLCNTFINSLFSVSPIIWIFCKKSNI